MFENIETCQLIYRTHQLTGFYMIGTLVVGGLGNNKDIADIDLELYS